MALPNSIQEALLEIHKGLYPENYEFNEDDPGQATEWDSGTIEWVAADIAKALKQFDVKGAKFDIIEYATLTDEDRDELRRIGKETAQEVSERHPEWSREGIDESAHADAMDQGLNEFEYIEAKEISELVDEGIADFLSNDWEG